MYILPNATEFNNACASVDRTIATKCEVISGGVTTTMVGDGINGEIISMEWDNIVCSNDGLQIGTTCMDEFKMTYRPVTTTMSLMGKEIHPYVGLEFGSPATVTYVPLGVFYVTDSSTEDDGYTVNITAYDGMQKFMKDFNATTIGVTFPCKAWDLLEAIATYFGVTLTYDAIVYALLSSDDYYLYTSDDYRLVVSDAIDRNKHASLPEAYEGTYRDYIGWIVGLVGAYAHMGRNGDLVVSQYKDHGFEVGRNVQHMGGAKINYGGAVTYTSIVSGTEENPIYPTYYGGNAITYTNPFITQSELDHLCEGLLQVDGITVTPCDVAWRSNPCVDAGDIVSVVDKDGNNLSVYVMERVVRITGGLAEDLHCYGETEVAHTLNKSPLVTSFSNKINEAIKTASDYINNTKGVFEWIDNGDGTNGGFTIYETDDEKSWLRCTAGGIGISADGGLTYTNAITKNGIVASQIDVQNSNGVGILKVFSIPQYSEAHIRMGNGDTLTTESGHEGFLVTVNQAGSFMRFRNPRTGNTSLHFISAYTNGGGDYGYYSYSNLYIVDPITDNHVISLDSTHQESGGVYNATVRVINVADDTLPAVMMTSRSTNGVITNDAGVYRVAGGGYAVSAIATPTQHEFRITGINNETVFVVTHTSQYGSQMYFNGHNVTWQTKTINGVTINYLGY